MSMPQPSPRFHPASEIIARPVEWLWPGRLALGQLAILEGDPGLGKSYLALDLCARLSTGRPWPDGAPARPPATSVFLSGEDSEEETLGPRLRSLGAAPDRVFFLDRGDGDLTASLSLPYHAEALEEVMARTGARLVVIDPLTCFLDPGVSLSTERGVRRVLTPLAALARRRACTVLLLRHLTKTDGGPALYRGLGSVRLVGVCRFAWLVGRDPEAPERRILAQVKNNLAAPQPSLAFEMTPADGGPPTLNWLGPVAATADVLAGTGRRRGRPPVKRRDAAAFLTAVLADGPMKVYDIWARAEREGLSSTTVDRAKNELGICSRVVTAPGGGRAYYWLMPDQELPGQESSEQAMEDEVERWLERQHELYPPRTPLEE